MPEAERYSARLEAGLCVSCGTEPAAGGFTRCAACAERVQELNAARRARLRLDGLCQKCGRTPAAKGRQHCGACLEYFASRAAAAC